MVRMINGEFGNEMWVADDRVQEYVAAGHKPAADPAEEKPAEAKPKRGSKKTRK